MKKIKNPIIITGMHRSGTSMLSRILERQEYSWALKKK